MKVTKSQKGEGFTISASLDETRLLANMATDYRGAPEEKALARKMTGLLITALPDVEGDDDDSDDDLYEQGAAAGSSSEDDDI